MSVKDSPVKGGAVKGGGARPKAMDRSDRQAAADGRALGLGTGWTVFSYLIGGMVAYGGIGWLIGRAVHVALLFPVGMLVGMGISLGYIIYRFGKQQGAEAPPARKEMTGDR
jgi:ATP synthase protein I